MIDIFLSLKQKAYQKTKRVLSITQMYHQLLGQFLKEVFSYLSVQKTGKTESSVSQEDAELHTATGIASDSTHRPENV